MLYICCIVLWSLDAFAVSIITCLVKFVFYNSHLCVALLLEQYNIIFH